MLIIEASSLGGRKRDITRVFLYLYPNCGSIAPGGDSGRSAPLGIPGISVRQLLVTVLTYCLVAFCCWLLALSHVTDRPNYPANGVAVLVFRSSRIKPPMSTGAGDSIYITG